MTTTGTSGGKAQPFLLASTLREHSRTLAQPCALRSGSLALLAFVLDVSGVDYY
jgi:hypothetical protein